MKVILIILLGWIASDKHQSLFQPDTDYLPCGTFALEYYVSAEAHGKPDKTDDKSGVIVYTGIRGWRLIPFRTVMVPARQILPGSVLFIPQLNGIKLPNGTIHDGYVLAHDVMPGEETGRIKLYTGSTRQWWNPEGTVCDVYRVEGVMASTIRQQYKLQYRDKTKKQTYEMTWKELQSLMQMSRKIYPDINNRIQYIAGRGLGTPYVIFNLGEGGSAQFDPDPLINFSQTDCMTFCEHTLAMAISETYQEMFQNLQKIRYKHGQIDIRTRNHYTLADWLPNNSWLLKDVTSEIGGSVCKQMTKTIDRRKNLLALGIPEKELNIVPPAQELVITYVPKESLARITANLKGGEIVSIVSNLPGIFSAHMGIIVLDEWNNIIFRHGSSLESVDEVVDVPYSEVISRLMKSRTRVGMVFMRINKRN